MGGGDKGLRALGSCRILDHVIARLAPQCAGLALNANGDPARFAEFGLSVLPDSLGGGLGPLAGVLAGLDWAAQCGADSIVTVAADTPFFPDNLSIRLAQSVGPTGLCVAASPDATENLRRHPTFGLWPVPLRHDLRAALQGGLRKMVTWVDRHEAETAVFASDTADPFFNINTPEDIAIAERLLQDQTG